MQSKSQNLNWDKSYSDGSHECHGYSIQPVSTGGYIVCGGTVTASHGKDIYVIKTDEDGDTLWTKTIGGAYDDEGYCVRECNDGGFMIAGYTGSYGNGAYDFFLVKTDEDGAIEYTRTNGGTLNEGSYNIIQTNDSGYLAVGYSYSSGHGGSDVKAVKYSKTGQVEWSNTYGTAYNEFGYSVCQMRDTGYVICGSTARGASDSLDVYVIRTNKSGDTLWTKTYKHEGFDCAYSVYACAETGFVIAGKTNLNDQSNTDMLFMKIFDDGTEIFTKTYGQSGYNEIAYDVKETDKNSFILVGTTDANSQGIDGYVVHTDDHGELLEETYYGGEGDDEFRSLCVKENDEFVVTGTVGPSVGIVGYLPCSFTLPRTLWYNQCWEYNSCHSTSNRREALLVPDDLVGTADAKIDMFVEYCRLTKIHTVVLGNLEDIIRQDNTSTTFSNYPTCAPCSTLSIDGDDLRVKLFSLVRKLHIDGQVSTVLAQWRDGVKDNGINKYDQACHPWSYLYDENEMNIDHNTEILEGFKILNSSLIVLSSRFDGIMLDYEYFTPLYGTPNTYDYLNAKTGYDRWNDFAYLLFTAKSSGLYGINILQAYLSRCVFMYRNASLPSDYFDTDGDNDTDVDDSKKELSDIDALGFNKLALAFFVNDEMDMPSPGTNPVPTTFLSGFQGAGNNPPGLKGNGAVSEEQRYRWRVQMLGHDVGNIKTKFEPVFMSRNNKFDYYETPPNQYDCGGSPDPKLGNLLLGACYWAGNDWPVVNGSTSVHYLPEIEYEFFNQYINKIGYDNDATNGSLTDPYTSSDYGTTDLAGFQWYQYSTYWPDANTFNESMVALSYYDIYDRPGDQNQLFIDCMQARSSPTPTAIPETIKDALHKNKTQLKTTSSISILPNPMTQTGGKIIISDCEPVSFKFSDVYGNDVGSKITLQPVSAGKYILLPNRLDDGVYILTLTYGSQKKIRQSFSIIN